MRGDNLSEFRPGQETKGSVVVIMYAVPENLRKIWDGYTPCKNCKTDGSPCKVCCITLIAKAYKLGVEDGTVSDEALERARETLSDAGELQREAME